MTHIVDSPIPAPAAEGQSFAEAHSPIANSLQRTRMEAVQAGLTPVSQGMTSALTALVGAVNARTVVETGAALDTSALPLLAGMTSGGVLTGIDSGADNQLPTRSFLNTAGYPPSRCQPITGAPLRIFPKLRDGAYNIVFINDDRLEYVECMTATLRLLRPGGLLIIHDVLQYNTIADPGRGDDGTTIIREALDMVRAADSYTATLLMVGNGLLVAVKD